VEPALINFPIKNLPNVRYTRYIQTEVICSCRGIYVELPKLADKKTSDFFPLWLLLQLSDEVRLQIKGIKQTRIFPLYLWLIEATSMSLLFIHQIKSGTLWSENRRRHVCNMSLVFGLPNWEIHSYTLHFRSRELRFSEQCQKNFNF
jgi:hypothetical protein